MLSFCCASLRFAARAAFFELGSASLLFIFVALTNKFFLDFFEKVFSKDCKKITHVKIIFKTRQRKKNFGECFAFCDIATRRGGL